METEHCCFEANSLKQIFNSDFTSNSNSRFVFALWLILVNVVLDNEYFLSCLFSFWNSLALK